ncbi:Rpn family recombination-promoting nuclease/putative transposase [Methanobrevibacter filiformis]|uniref:PD-(D/E)XK nuclease family transposase n=1 Tax=Methanobrevibacter filiformis TaxID=55758 RepID=A0A166DWI5_9EURY|nr:Rpn family recombination-promoting nuclease/putative transposase [Methanobrevibacter filiformis]KZX16024.1 PD-(D/E)XK nuclease family transposase [Methanobrevibacter filiformis]
MKVKNRGCINIKIKNIDENINLLNDFLFAKIFGEKGSEKYALYLINTLSKKEFKHVKFEPNQIQGTIKNKKKSILDVYVTTDDGTLINIESQINKQEDFHKRSHYYASKALSLELGTSESYLKVPLVMTINLLAFKFQAIEKYHTTYIHCEKEERHHELDDLEEMHFFELKKFRKLLKNNKIDFNNPEHRLMLFLDEQTPQKIIEKVIKMDSVLNEVYDRIEHSMQDRNSYFKYLSAEKIIRDEKAKLDYATKKGIEKGEQIGEQRGIEKGEQIGEQRGIEKGRIEGKEEGELENSKKIAFRLKNNGMTLEEISKITDLSIEQIEEL